MSLPKLSVINRKAIWILGFSLPSTKTVLTNQRAQKQTEAEKTIPIIDQSMDEVTGYRFMEVIDVCGSLDGNQQIITFFLNNYEMRQIDSIIFIAAVFQALTFFYIIRGNSFASGQSQKKGKNTAITSVPFTKVHNCCKYKLRTSTKRCSKCLHAMKIRSCF